MSRLGAPGRYTLGHDRRIPATERVSRHLLHCRRHFVIRPTRAVSSQKVDCSSGSCDACSATRPLRGHGARSRASEQGPARPPGVRGAVITHGPRGLPAGPRVQQPIALQAMTLLPANSLPISTPRPGSVSRGWVRGEAEALAAPQPPSPPSPRRHPHSPSSAPRPSHVPRAPRGSALRPSRPGVGCQVGWEGPDGPGPAGVGARRGNAAQRPFSWPCLRTSGPCRRALPAMPAMPRR